MTAPSTPPESWLLIEAIKTRLQAITIANGFRTDAGLDVVTEYARVKESPEVAQLYVFLDGVPQNAETSSRKWRDRVVPIVAQGRFRLSHSTAQRQAHDLLDDLDMMFPPDAPQLTDAEFALEQESLSIIQRPWGAEIVMVQLALLVSHRVYNKTA